MISLNKRNTGELNEEFNLRHDWHSLLNEEDQHPEQLKFTSYSKENFPSADTLLEYLNDFKTKFNLNVKYETTINNINCIYEKVTLKKHNETFAVKKKCLFFEMFDQNVNKYNCRYNLKY